MSAVQQRSSTTEANLRDAFSREAQAGARLLYFARLADIEGRAQVAALLRSMAEGESGHALGTIELLGSDPAGDLPIGSTVENLRAIIASQHDEGAELYPRYAAQARSEGNAEAADWFDTLAEAERTHVETLSRAIDALDES